MEIEQKIKELWVNVWDNDQYMVSNFGRVYSKRNNRVLKQFLNSYGYFMVSISGKQKRVHRLVLENFKGLAKENQISRHLDGDKNNNCIDNLEWGTQDENMNDKKMHQTQSHKGKTLTFKQAEDIKNDPRPYKEICSDYQVGYQMVIRIKNNRSWQKELKIEDRAYKLNWDIVKNIRNDSEYTFKELSEIYNISEPMVEKIKRNKTWIDESFVPMASKKDHMRGQKRKERLTQEQIQSIKEDEDKITQIAKKYNVTRQTVYAIKKA